jgi:disulfide bond formation protein DsbB
MPYILCWAVVGFHVCDTPRKATTLLNTFLKSAAIKAAIIVLYFHVEWHGSKLKPSGDGDFEYVSSHWDGLFAGVALVFALNQLLTIRQWPKRIPLLAQAALIGYGWALNDRRISFLGVFFSLSFLGAIFAAQMPRAKLMRHLPHAIAAGCVGLAAFLVPASPLHSLIADEPSGQLDYRDIENYNLFRMIGEKSILGWGYGRPFEQYFPLPDIFGFAEVLSWIPHNNILMTWAFAGVFGLSALGLVFSFGTAVSVRLLGATTDTATKVFAASAFSAVVQWVFYAWADMGLTVSVMTPVPACLIGISARLLLKANSEGATRILERG